MNNRTPLKISARAWLWCAALACVSMAGWLKFGYPQFAAMDLSVGKAQAVTVARDFLKSRGVDPSRYLQSAVFDSDRWADTYLQKTLGLEQEERFIRDQGYGLFFWKVRFFRQFEKEEYVFEISPTDGGIAHFEHKIPDTEPRPSVGKEEAAAAAAASLKGLGIDFSGYDFNEEKAKRFDTRTDYSFSWEKKGVYIPWKEGKGGAKLIAGATIAGGEVLEFYVNELDLPESFYRYIERQMYFGEYLSSFSQILFVALIIFALIIMLGRRTEIITRFVRDRFLFVAGFLAVINFLSLINDLQDVLMNYTTSASLSSYLGIYFLRSIMGVVFIGVVFAVPAIAGEIIQPETLPASRNRSLTHYLLSSFSTRAISSSVLLGYLFFFFLLGLQAVIFSLGQKYFGVWKQWIKLTEFSSAYIPFFSAFAVGVTASLTEEAVFRGFAVPWGRKVFGGAVAAVVFSSLAWGFGHTQYAIFPVWFRGIEVTLIGLCYGFVFLRFGIIPLIVAHYLFDVFWGVAPYLLAKSSLYLLSGSVFLLALPLVGGAYAFARNRKETERTLEALLDPVQHFNLAVMAAFIRERIREGKSVESAREELLNHKWDPTMVDIAVKESGNREQG